MIVINQDSISVTLKKYFDDAKRRNPNYTLRSFAKKLNLSSGSLSEILNKNRRITRKKAEEILSKLDLDCSQKESFIESFVINEKIQYINNDAPKKINIERMESEHWKIFAILNIIETDNFIFDVTWIAKRLVLKESEVKEIIDYLFQEKLIKIASDSKLKRTANRLKTSDGILSVAIKNGHMINCDLARRSILETPINERDLTSTTMPIDPTKLEEAREIIRRFHNEMYAFLSTGKNITEVYKLNIQLFPLTIKK